VEGTARMNGVVPAIIYIMHGMPDIGNLFIFLGGTITFIIVEVWNFIIVEVILH
jgi:hypothetical protein